MKVFLHDIREDGLNIDKTVQASDIELVDEDFKCLAPLRIKANIQRADEAIIANVEVEGSFEIECARCLEPAVRKRKNSFVLYFDVTPKTEFIELGEDIRQEIVLALTSVELCKNDCKGICPSCGANLNNEKCKCSKEEKKIVIPEEKLEPQTKKIDI